MALFSKEKKKIEDTEEVKKTEKDSVVLSTKTNNLDTSLAGVLLRPRITEKATDLAEKNVYVFDVSNRSTKTQIAKAITFFYKVVPKKINITKTPSKVVFIRGKAGVRSGGKKANVYLKEGDKIEFV